MAEPRQTLYLLPAFLTNRKMTSLSGQTGGEARKAKETGWFRGRHSVPIPDTADGRSARDMLEGRKWGQGQGEEVTAGLGHLQAAVGGEADMAVVSQASKQNKHKSKKTVEARGISSPAVPK